MLPIILQISVVGKQSFSLNSPEDETLHSLTLIRLIKLRALHTSTQEYYKF